jgi:hypothetical protein
MTPDQLKEYVDGAIRHRDNFAILYFIAVPIFSFIAAFIGAYLKEKGKNLATKEDLDVLIDQMRKTTATVEEVKAEIAGEAWLKQQIWTEKKKVYIDILQALQQANYSAAGMAEGFRLSQAGSHDEMSRKTIERQIEAHGSNYPKARSKVLQFAAAAQIVISAEAWSVLERYEESVDSSKCPDMQTYFDALVGENEGAIANLVKAARRDLGFMASETKAEG